MKYESVNVELGQKAAIEKTGGSRPFAMEATAWRDIL